MTTPEPLTAVQAFDGGHSISPDGTPYWSEPRPVDFDQWLIGAAPILRDAYVAYVTERIRAEARAAALDEARAALERARAALERATRTYPLYLPRSEWPKWEQHVHPETCEREPALAAIDALREDA